MRVKIPDAMSDKDDKARTAHEAESIKRIRAACSNQLHLAATVLADDDLRRILVGLSRLVYPLRRFHGDQSRFNKNSESGLAFAQRMARGWSRQPLCDVVAVLGDLSVLEECGLWVGGAFRDKTI